MKKEVREKDLEAKLKQVVERYGGLFYKFTSPGNDGVPDRIVVLPDGQVWFIELKTETGVTSPIQDWQIERLRSRHAKVAVLHGQSECIDWWADRLGELYKYDPYTPPWMNEAIRKDVVKHNKARQAEVRRMMRGQSDEV